MADDGASEKTEKASAKRRKDSRNKGDIPMYKDVTTVCTLIVSMYTLYLVGAGIVETVFGFLLFCTTLMSEPTVNLITDNGELIFQTMIDALLSIIVIPLVVTVSTSIIVTMYQTKGLVAKEKLKLKFEVLNPSNIISGVKKLFSLNSLFDAAKNIVKIIFLFTIIYFFYTEHVLSYRVFFQLDLGQSGVVLMEDLFALSMQIALAFGTIAIADAFYQKWKWEKDHRMSKQDLKEEYKQQEGDPKIKAKIKRKQMELAQNRMMQDVPKADVIVRNPTHYAVALRYNRDIDFAPIILAMGEDELAFRIIKIGEKHDVPIVENVTLARALYANGEVQKPIPFDLYNVVAKLLVDVLGIGKKAK